MRTITSNTSAFTDLNSCGNFLKLVVNGKKGLRDSKECFFHYTLQF